MMYQVSRFLRQQEGLTSVEYIRTGALITIMLVVGTLNTIDTVLPG